MKYIIVSGINPQALTEKVNEYIRKGWKPLGGVAWKNVDEEYPESDDLAQAMIYEYDDE